MTHAARDDLDRSSRRLRRHDSRAVATATRESPRPASGRHDPLWSPRHARWVGTTAQSARLAVGHRDQRPSTRLKRGRDDVVVAATWQGSRRRARVTVTDTHVAATWGSR